MFTQKFNYKNELLEKNINDLHRELDAMMGDSEEYAKTVDQLTKLYAIKEQDAPKRIPREAWVALAGNLGGILVIVGHERANVVTSKALGFVSKLR